MKFHDLSADSFPFTMELLDAETREVCWTATADGPGAVQVPGYREVNDGKPVAVRMTFGNGEVSVVEPGEV